VYARTEGPTDGCDGALLPIMLPDDGLRARPAAEVVSSEESGADYYCGLLS
jgi:hypothetical protein